MFGPRFARHLARRYRRHGLDRTARRMVDFLEQQGVQGSTILEIGGGVGEIQLELLRRGAAHATNLELSSAYDGDAATLAAESGMSDRVTRRRLDIAAEPDEVEAADIVVLHRVVCCYPDYERLLAAAATHAKRLVVFSYPPRNVVSRAGFAAQNAFFRLIGRTFRAFTHPPDSMIDVVEAHGFVAADRRRGTWWRTVGLVRTQPT
jgi:magnesium-protoporphyrin O-methyltransferase